MVAHIKTLKEDNGDIVYPITTQEAVNYDGSSSDVIKGDGTAGKVTTSNIDFTTLHNVMTAAFQITVTPSDTRGNSGWGETTVDISHLNIKRILSATFYFSSSHMLWGFSSNINAENPTSLGVYGFRIAGTYASPISVSVKLVFIPK